MSDRIFRLVLGLVLLAALYFDLYGLVVGMMGLMVFEGLTNLRICRVLCARLAGNVPDVAGDGFRFNFESERVLRLIVAALLFTGYVAFPEAAWFIPWFVGFALVGAGLSGICPMILALRWVGFR